MDELQTILKQWGVGVGIYFTKEEMKIYNLRAGDIVKFKIEKVEREVSENA